MRLNGIASVVALMVLLCLSSIPLAYADVPSVLEISREEEGGNTFLVIEVRHGSPTSSHYVDVIEVEVDGEVEKLDDLEPQASTRFEERYAVDPDAEIRVRAHCNVHGWSRWAGEEEGEPVGGGGIPGFPHESVALGAALVLLLLRRKSNPR
jgi:desulfoferrodoxin (superoxide reductase-like protein)